MVLSDSEWIRLRQEQHRHIVEPFLPDQCRVHSGVPTISYGLSSAGYDLRLDPGSLAVARISWVHDKPKTIDPKRVQENDYLVVQPNTDPETQEIYWRMGPGDYALGLSLEHITIPRDHIGICIGKSTYARCGLIINTTPLEPGWHGRLVIELFNAQKDNHLKVYAKEGIAQLLLFPIKGEVRTSYDDRQGKYQDQQVITYAKV